MDVFASHSHKARGQNIGSGIEFFSCEILPRVPQDPQLLHAVDIG